MTRSELIHSLLDGSSCKRVFRGNTIWCVEHEEGEASRIVCYRLYANEYHDWKYEETKEDDGFTNLSCPLKYLDETIATDLNWRQNVKEYFARRLTHKQNIKKMFKEGRKTERIVRVEIEAREGHAIPAAVFDVVSIHQGIEGRAVTNGLRYLIPMKMVKDVRFIPRAQMGNPD